jgi:hypothetical protein
MSQATATPIAAPPTTVSCPRCKQPLIDPQGLGWCKACGYCRSLADSEKQAGPAPEAPAKPSALAVTGSALTHMPAWIWISLLGVIVVAGATYAAGRYLTLTPLHRALLTTIEMAAGVLLMFVGQFLGVLRIAPEDSNMGFFDAIVPFRLYSLIFKRLPTAQTTLFFGAWGITAIVSAVIFVGGLGHWMNYLPKSQGQQKVQVYQPN